MMDSAARRYAGLSVPRYTSYPTAADFTPLVAGKDLARWLGRLDATEPVSIYLHVPYCRELCFYCGCNTKMALRDSVVLSYRDALIAEIALVSGLLKAPLRVSRLHWGGGTPSILGAEGLRRVVDELERHVSFERDLEHAIELDPRYVTVELSDGSAALGVTRASLGVQDINPLVQAAIGRVQPLGMIEAAVDRLRGAGIKKLSFDLMYGLPLQTPKSIRTTCAAVSALAPDRISCFGYAHLPRLKANQRQIDEAKLPGLDQRIKQAELIEAELVRHGYAKIGIDHFARPGDSLAFAAASGRLHRNFQGYTDDDRATLLGFGASSISTLADGYVQNVADVPRYVSTVASGMLATIRGCRLSADDRRRAQIIERLMCEFEVDLAEIAPGVDFGEELAMLQPMQQQGLLTRRGTTLALTEIGRPVARVVAAAFDTYRRPPSRQFSTAI
ncbi:oxygen-independent coproporphyrinogen III oxidase [Bradyrhizobium erythrophlei]|uniref:oxygen-independent coproporphyrinogen III oxidase n=1 Tax=Bradyrhizobium erythrophlei TaxID=1437360 RepID=UPI0035E9BA74